MTAQSKQQTVKLDWTRLLGFDQVGHNVERTSPVKLSDPRLVKLGLKPGVKSGVKRQS